MPLVGSSGVVHDHSRGIERDDAADIAGVDPLPLPVGREVEVVAVAQRGRDGAARLVTQVGGSAGVAGEVLEVVGAEDVSRPDHPTPTPGAPGQDPALDVPARHPDVASRAAFGVLVDLAPDAHRLIAAWAVATADPGAFRPVVGPGHAVHPALVAADHVLGQQPGEVIPICAASNGAVEPPEGGGRHPAGAEHQRNWRDSAAVRTRERRVRGRTSRFTLGGDDWVPPKSVDQAVVGAVVV